METTIEIRDFLIRIAKLGNRYSEITSTSQLMEFVDKCIEIAHTEIWGMYRGLIPHYFDDLPDEEKLKIMLECSMSEEEIRETVQRVISNVWAVHGSINY